MNPGPWEGKLVYRNNHMLLRSCRTIMAVVALVLLLGTVIWMATFPTTISV